jgi:long-chain acyl-CoA synthetase
MMSIAIERLADDLRPERFSSLNEVFDYISTEHRDRDAYSCFGRVLSYGELGELANRFAAYLRSQPNLEPGDHIAIQLPNLLMFPVAFWGAIKAGLVVVNTNPLYTAHEMEHQFKDSGVKAIVILENFCDKLEQIIDQTRIESIIICRLGDLQPTVKSFLINSVARYIRRMVPRYKLRTAVRFTHCLNVAPDVETQDLEYGSGDDVAVILYTGGTTGFAKGAMLSHNNLIANMMQLRSRCLLVIEDRIETLLAPLPLYHSYAFLLHCLAMPFAGNHNVLIPNPRDLDSVIKIFKEYPISGLVGINTLYLALLRHPQFAKLDFSRIKFCGAGGMAMSTSVLEQWQQVTGSEIFEGYGLTECSPVVSVNLPGEVKPGTVGRLVPETEIKAVDEEGNEVPVGERGEAWIRGPQVMLGYWGQEQATKEAITEDGWFKTGDYVELDEEGFISIVDRKKDMILVSGFNVFPNEVEDWVNQHPEIIESAAIGVPDERTGERIKLFVVCTDNAPSEKEIIAHCKEGLTSYKIPREIVYKDDLPKSIIGKIIRRELR